MLGVAVGLAASVGEAELVAVGVAPALAVTLGEGVGTALPAGEAVGPAEEQAATASTITPATGKRMFKVMPHRRIPLRL